MLQHALQRVLSEYPSARQEPFAQHPLANFIRSDVPDYLANEMAEFSTITWEGSPGRGNWAEAPWIAGFHVLVTDTAQAGYYPVYLFGGDFSSVTLSFNQGITLLREESGTPRARETLLNRASVIRHRVPEYIEYFPERTLELNSAGTASSLLSMYEHGHAFGKTYYPGQIPTDESLLTDLRRMLNLYELLVLRGGTDDIDTELDIDDAEQEAFEELAERKKYRLHRRIDRNSKLAKEAKKVHGYRCQVCGIDFEKEYGDLGKNYIEAHHKTPLAELPDDMAVSLSPVNDFAVVCANCHRMIHRKDAPETFEAFVEYYRSLHSK